MKPLNEKLLLYRIRIKHDPEAFGLIYDEFVDKIYRFVLLKISHKQDTEDIVSDVFLKTWKYLINNDNQVKSLSGLIYSIARNCVVDWYRNRAKKNECSLDGLEVDIKDNAPNKNLAMSEAESLIKKIKLLKQDYQELLLLRFVDELSYLEISQITGKSLIAVRVTLHRAVKKLKEMVVI